jgi:hypothetical protein
MTNPEEKPTEPQEEEAPPPEETAPQEEPKEEQEEELPEGEEEKPEAEGEPEGESAEEEEKPEAKAETSPPKPKARNGFQRKIERLERINEQLVQRLTQGSPDATAAKPNRERTSEEKAADALDLMIQQRLDAREAEQREKTVVSEFQRRTAEARAAYEDFEDVVTSADIPIQSALGQALLTSEHGPAIMYQLAKNRVELERLSALPPLDAAREIGRLEAKLASVTAPAKTNGTAKRPAAPPTSVRGTTSTTRSLETLSMSDYKRAMRTGRR